MRTTVFKILSGNKTLCWEEGLETNSKQNPTPVAEPGLAFHQGFLLPCHKVHEAAAGKDLQPRGIFPSPPQRLEQTWDQGYQWNVSRSDVYHVWAKTVKSKCVFLPSLSPPAGLGFKGLTGMEGRSLGP